MSALAIDHPAAWHEARRQGIGGSDIPILAGLSPYRRGPHELFLEKTGLLEPQPASPAMEVGSVIEDAIATLYARRTGRTVVRSNVLARHPDHPWAIGNIDRKVRGERRLVEIKNRRWMPKRELPADVECQVQWYLGITRYPVADVAILVQGSDLRITEVAADEAYFADLLTIARDFMGHVERGEPPPIDGSDETARYLAARYPWHQTEVLAPPDATLEAMAEELRDALAVEALAKGRLTTVKNTIKALLGDSPGVETDDWKITWKRFADSTRTDWKAVAAALHPPRALVEKHTVTIEGTRHFQHWGLAPEGFKEEDGA